MKNAIQECTYRLANLDEERRVIEFDKNFLQGQLDDLEGSQKPKRAKIEPSSTSNVIADGLKINEKTTEAEPEDVARTSEGGCLQAIRSGSFGGQPIVLKLPC